MDHAKLDKAIKLRDEIKKISHLLEAINQHEKDEPRAVFLQLINEWRNISDDKTKNKYLKVALHFLKGGIIDDIDDLNKQFEEL